MAGDDDVARQTPDLSAVVSRAAVAWAPVGAEVVVRSDLTRSTFVLDPVSAVLWQCLDTSSPLAEVLTDIADGFGVPFETAVADCVPAVRSWIEAGIAVDLSLPTLAEQGPRMLAEHDDESGRRWRRLVDPPNS